VENPRELLAVNLIRLRSERGWSQETLALEAGVHRTAVAHVERRSRNVSLESLHKFAIALEVPIAELLRACTTTRHG